MRASAPVALALALLLGACSEPNVDLAEAGLLTLGDLGEGWTQQDDAEVGPFGGGSGDMPDECDDLIRTTEAGVDTEGSSPAFTKGAPGPSAEPAFMVTNFVAVYRQEEIAVTAADTWRDETQAVPCLELLMSALVEGLRGNPFFDAAFGAYDVAATPLPVPAVGDGVVGWRARLDLHTADIPGAPEQVTIVFDFVVARVERAVSLGLYGAFFGEPPADVRDASTGAVVGRMAEAA